MFTSLIDRSHIDRSYTDRSHTVRPFADTKGSHIDRSHTAFGLQIYQTNSCGKRISEGTWSGIIWPPAFRRQFLLWGSLLSLGFVDYTFSFADMSRLRCYLPDVFYV